MRKIDKTVVLSIKYKQWVEKLSKMKKRHPLRSERYYTDVIMNLLHCQKGVCAYTEMLICNPKRVAKSNWKHGRYIKKKVEQLGSLDHFDPKFKKKTYWDWDNLFFVHSKINVIKNAKDIECHDMKPDVADYDPFKFLKYSFGTNLFAPLSGSDVKCETESIDKMIDILQLNHDTVVYERETFLAKYKVLDVEHLEALHTGQFAQLRECESKTNYSDEVSENQKNVRNGFEVDRFFTAFEMMLAGRKREQEAK